jgi:predicted nucleic-acid-binding protein
MTASKAYLVDANILLRYLRNDHPKQSPAARRLIEGAGKGALALEIPLIAITETVFTLQSHYGAEREDIGRELIKILRAPGVTLACPDWALDALEFYRTRNVSFGDACIAAEAVASDREVASFDQGLKRFPEITRHEPS